MRIGDFTTPTANLNEALEQLEIAWAHARETWDDSTADKFEENCLAPLRPKLKTTIYAINRISEVMARAERECTPPQEF